LRSDTKCYGEKTH